MFHVNPYRVVIQGKADITNPFIIKYPVKGKRLSISPPPTPLSKRTRLQLPVSWIILGLHCEKVQSLF